MRVLYISHTHPAENNLLANAGGMQRVSYQLIKALKKRSDVSLQTETIHAGFRGNINLQTALFLAKMLFRLEKKARYFNADVILFSSMVTASLAPFLRKKLDLPLVTINHGQDVTKPVTVYQKFIPKVFESLDGVISVSRATRRQCIERGMDPEKGVALPNGIDIESFTFPGKKKSRSILEQKVGIPLNQHKMLLTVGRFVERKGHRWFIKEVLPNLRSDVVYVTVGSGPELANVKEEAAKSFAADKIFILGRQSDIALKQAYAAADLFIMPNVSVKGDMEGFGIVMLEANLAETPVIASDLEGIKDVISNGVNGFKIPPLDAQRFAEKTDETLTGDLNLLSARSCKHARERFNWTHVANLYVEFLKKTVQK